MQFVKSLIGLLGVLGCAASLLAGGPAEARRVALVIGNADYKVGPLQNPLNDAAAVANAIEKMGFDKVVLRQNLGIEGFRAALMEMSREATGAEQGVLYFAGHGVEAGGRNFLIPVDAVLARQSDLDLQAIALDTVIGQLGGVTGLKLVILDACRTNAFPLAGTTRKVGRGLARIEPENNMLVVYASKEGTTADDGVGRKHSPFSAALLKHIASPNLEVRLLFGRVRDEVVHLTRHAAEPQEPHIYGTLGGLPHYLQPVDPTSVSPAAQRLRAQEEELVRLRAAKAKADEQLGAERKAKAQDDARKAAEDAKRKQVVARPTPPAPGPSSGRSCSYMRVGCVKNCQDQGAPFTKCTAWCGEKHASCLQTGTFERRGGKPAFHGLVKK
jgi:uncharacterized caspase-like protein